jgi:hypothetical protein
MYCSHVVSWFELYRCIMWEMRPLCLIYVSFETHDTWSLFCDIFYLSGLWTWKIPLWWVLCVWYYWCIYICKDHECFRIKMYGVMFLYLLLCYISCHMHHGFILSHTCTPWMQWFRGSLLCVLICANWHLRWFF